MSLLSMVWFGLVWFNAPQRAERVKISMPEPPRKAKSKKIQIKSQAAHFQRVRAERENFTEKIRILA
jgi:hypothetical protein